MANFREAFPDFDPATLPAIPGGFKDASWGNDVCPAFICEAADLCIWVDFADVQLRELQQPGPRFRLEQMEDGQHVASDESILCASDEWQEIIVAALAEVHANTLAEWLGLEQYAQMRQRNAADPKAATGDVCHSHDFCDANMAMAQAFETVLGREIFTPVDAEGGAATEAQVEADCVLANAAWARASACYLTAKPGDPQVEDDGLTGSQRRAQTVEG